MGRQKQQAFTKAFRHSCEKGYMFKSTLTDSQGRPVMYYYVHQTGLFKFSYLYFRGICDFCGQEFEIQEPFEATLNYYKT